MSETLDFAVGDSATAMVNLVPSTTESATSQPAQVYRLDPTIMEQSPGRTFVAIHVRDSDNNVVHCERITVQHKPSLDKLLGTLVGIYKFDREDAKKKLLGLIDAKPTEDKPADDDTDAVKISLAELDKTPEDIRDEAQRILEDATPGALLKWIIATMAKIGIAGEINLSTVLYVIFTSRLLAKPASAIIRGNSSSGKSYTAEKVASLVPDEWIIRASRLTPQSLFYLKRGALRHRIILAGERSRLENDDAAEATRTLREFLSAGIISLLRPEKKPDGSMATERIEQPGPISFVESTTLARIFGEDANRCLLLNADESAEQTQRVVRMLAAKYSRAPDSNVGASPEEQVRVVAVHHAMQRLIAVQPAEVVIPYAGRLGEAFPAHRVEVRRAFEHVLTIVSAVALLHRFQRKLDASGAVIAEPSDYQIAHRLLEGPLSKSLGKQVSPAAKELYTLLCQHYPNEPFSAAKILRDKLSRASKPSVLTWLKELDAADVLELDAMARGNRPAEYRLVAGHPVIEDTPILPPVSVIG